MQSDIAHYIGHGPRTHIADEGSAERNELTSVLRDLECLLPRISTGTHQRAWKPDVANEFIGLRIIQSRSAEHTQSATHLSGFHLHRCTTSKAWFDHMQVAKFRMIGS